MDENFLNFASQVMNDWTDDIKRIADALERISPPHGFDYMSTMNLDGLDDAVAQGWQAYSVTEGGANYSGVWYHMRRPRQAPAAEDESTEYRCECGAYGETERKLTVEHKLECHKGISF